MSLEITHQEKPTINNKIDDNGYMLPHVVTGDLPDIWDDPIQTHDLNDSLGVTLDNLDGENDGIYKVTGDFTVTSPGEVFLRFSPNGIQTAQFVRGFRSGSAYNFAGSLIASAPTASKAPDELHFVLYYMPKSGGFRYGRGSSIWLDYSASDVLPFNYNIYWREKVTHITYFELTNLYEGKLSGKINLYKAPLNSKNFW